MNRGKLARLFQSAFFILLAATLLSANAALAQGEINNLRVTDVEDKSITLSWDDTPGSSGYGYDIFIGPARGNSNDPVGGTDGTSYIINGLRPGTDYRIIVVITGNPHLGHSVITVRTGGAKRKLKKTVRYTPPDVTCPHLPPRVAVYGYIENTQCQMVGEIVIAKTDLIQRGFIDAVDVWSVMPDSLEVCFRNEGWLVFLDAAYAPRMVMELEHYHRDGMTCGVIDRAGTVALLREAATPDSAPQPEPEGNILPIFDAIPLSDCQIKLEETLFLRAEPAGEIIGLVWLNSEVPVFEINGYWYKVEFEGVTGYISRYHREVLRGGCG